MLKKYFYSRSFILYLFPLVLGSMTVLSFQPFNLTIINFIILPLFFYLVVYVKKKSKSVYRKKPYKKNLFILSSCFGFGFYLSGIHWINHSLTFDDSFKILIPFGLVLIPLFLSIFFSFAILIVGPLLNFNLSSILLFSGSLAFSDYLRAKILTGFPWNIWAYSFSWATEILQILNKIGFFTFNLIAITIFMLPAAFFLKIDLMKKSFTIMSLLLVVFILYIYGNHSINQNKNYLDSQKEKFYIKIVSPNLKLKYGLDSNEIFIRLKQLIRFSDPQSNVKTLFVWPEGVFSGYSFSEIENLKKIFLENFSENHLILFGVNRLNIKKNKYFNSLIVINNQMEILGEYNKQKLVPFGEFLPFEKFLNKFGLKKITEGHGSFLRGNLQENLLIDKLNILPLICYEIIFTKFTQQSDKDTNLIVNISEDGWFGNSIGPEQHFAKAVFRAIEQNSFLIRSANKGISAIINNKGIIVKKLDANEAGNIDLQVPLIKSKNRIKNDLIFFILLITYIFIFYYCKNNNEK